MVRLLPEWELTRAVLLAYPSLGSDWTTHLYEARACVQRIVGHILEYQDVILLHGADVHRVRADFPTTGRHRLWFYQTEFNDTWTRDYGPITIAQNDQLKLLDFQFNGWGLKFPANLDNQITAKLHAASLLGEHPLQTEAMILEGGSIETDGRGTLLTTRACLRAPNRNPTWQQADFEHYFRKTLGIERVLWLNHGYIPGDDTDAHIDTLARFCDPETICYVGPGSSDDHQRQQLHLMEEQLKTFRQPNGKPYRLVPLPAAPPIYAEDGHALPATYANFLILRGAVLLPLYGVGTDTAALETLKRIFPKRKVIGVDCRVLIEQHGSLHCMTMGVG